MSGQILVADDDGQIRDVVRIALGQAGSRWPRRRMASRRWKWRAA